MKGKVKVFVASLEISSHFGNTDEMCKYCTSSHRTEIVTQQLKHSIGSNSYLPNDQREIVNMTREFCKENNFEMEVVDIANLKFLEKMKLAFKGIKAPSIVFEDNVVNKKPTKEQLKALILHTSK